MKKESMIEEHRRLVRILTTGTKAEQLKEAKGQKEELKEMIKPKIREKLSRKG
jgi:hypothetical protein